MTATCDPAEVERLVREAREDDARMAEAPWTASNTPAVYKTVPYEANVSRWYRITSDAVTLDDAIGIARTRNNLRAMTDQLEAASARIVQLTETARAASENWMDACRQRDEARARIAEIEDSVERMAPVVAAAERYRDDGACYAGIVPAVDAYRAKIRGTG